MDLLPPEYDKKFFKDANMLISDISDTLAFYNAVSDDMREAFIKLQNFVTHVDEAARFDEEHLLPIALDVFGAVPFPVTTEYIPIKKNAKSKACTLPADCILTCYY